MSWITCVFTLFASTPFKAPLRTKPTSSNKVGGLEVTLDMVDEAALFLLRFGDGFPHFTDPLLDALAGEAETRTERLGEGVSQLGLLARGRLETFHKSAGLEAGEDGSELIGNLGKFGEKFFLLFEGAVEGFLCRSGRGGIGPGVSLLAGGEGRDG